MSATRLAAATLLLFQCGPMLEGEAEDVVPIEDADGTVEQDLTPIAVKPLGTALTPAEVYNLYKLGYSYADTVTHLKTRLASLDAYLAATPTTTLDTKTRDCTTGKVGLPEWGGNKSWAAVLEIAETFYFGAIITSHVAADAQLSTQLRAAVVRLADHVIAEANATQFYGLTHTDGTKPLGWTPFGGGWDAFSNGTCSPKEASTTWATSMAMQTIALAYRVTKAAKYRDAYLKALSYYFPRLNTNRFFVSGYEDLARIKDLFDNYNGGAYRVTPLYTVGGSRYQKVGGTAQEQVIRFHYHYDDPGHFALNVSSSMSLAVALGALSFPDVKVNVSDAKTSFAARPLANVATYSMLPIYRNLRDDNFGYHDVDSVTFIDRKPNSSHYEAHTPFTIYGMARTAFVVNNDYFRNETVRSVRRILDTTSFATPMSIDQLRLLCFHRQLNSSYLADCRRALASAPAAEKSYYKYLRASLVLLQDPPGM